ncbi:tape measure protein [Gordonia sp. ABSL11-1]|uniref:aggregation-promoting factor C-terminal-like domain-containing protein n=1 Tax=Gordonia sp. ABSL11-1 TaxID=3053924 RepID=UPI002573EDE7|nr:tape measure protein [Gordonia sp. ABSL11-1]MDL9944282.1 tape measure protein [Gordonia sp. ABSL11-1]
MTELASAYISIIAETSSVPPAIRKALGKADGDAAKAGKSMGAKLSGALGTALKGGAATAAAAGTAAIGATMVKGFQRLTAIDDAKGKLAGLGHTAQSTSTIMDSALSSVKGTSYGLGDAATIAASAVAAGIKPGQQLTKYLSMTADAASIAGVGLSEMGQVLNQTATSGVAMTDDLNQLADRGIPIYTWLGKEAGVAAGEVKGLASEGKISSEMLFRAIQQNIGGAARESGKTVSGSFDNVLAAMGRLGAAVEGPTFKRLPGFFGDITSRIDAATPSAERFAQALDAKVFDEWGPKLHKAFEDFRATGNIEQARTVFTSMMTAAGAAAPSIGQIARSLAQASATLGVSGWQLFLTALQVGTTTLNVLNPLLQTTASLMQNNQGLVTAFVAGWLAFKTVPNIVGAVNGPLGTVTSRLRTAGTTMRDFGAAYSTSMQYVRQANPSISTAGAHLQVLRQNGMNASGAMNALKGGAGLAAGALGGPLGIALAVGGIALGEYSKHQADAAQKAADHKQMIDALSDSVNYNTGQLTANGQAQVYKSLNDADAFANARKGGVAVSRAQIQSAGEGNQGALEAVNAEIDSVVRNRVSDVISDRQQEKLREAGLSIDDYTAALRGNADAQKKFADAGQGRDWGAAAKDLGETTQAAIKLGYALGDSNKSLKESRDSARQESEAMGTVQKNLTSLADQFKGQGKGFSVTVDTTQVAGAEQVLKAAGYALEPLKDGRVRITAETDEAAARLNLLANTVRELPPGKAIAVTSPGGIAVRDLLTSVGAKVNQDNTKEIEVTAPLAPAQLALLQQIGGEVVTRNGKQIVVTADDSDYQRKKSVWSQSETKWIEVRVADGTYGAGLGVLKPDSPLRQHANGGIAAYLNGGITAAEAYANGGLREIRKPTAADIFAGRGAGTIFAEEETGGEAYLPLAPGKRRRSTDILATVAKMFGYTLLPDGALPTNISDLLGAVSGSAVSRLLALPGSRFADGGIVTGDQLRALAEGKGASRPLRGAPYVSGGINWGDCSGAMSPFARLAAGLDPFGGRFATANEGDYLTKLGATLGRGAAGTLRFGWYNGGPGGGHTAGTLPDGTNIEMGGQNGGGMVGGSVGADDPQFTDHAWMAVKNANQYAGSSSADADSDSVATGSSMSDSGLASGYAFDPITSDTTSGEGDTSISGRLGAVANAFVSGQAASFMDLIKLSDSPGWLAALAEYDKGKRADARQNYESEKKKLDADYKDAEDQRKSDYDDAKEAIDGDYQSQIISAAERDRRMLALRNQYESDEIANRHDYENAVIGKGKQYGLVNQDSVSSLSLKQKYENDQLRGSQQLQSAEFDREAQYNRDKLALDNLKASHAISDDVYDRRLRDTKAKYDSDIRGLKDRYSSDQATLKSTFDRSQSMYAPSNRYLPNSSKPSTFHPTDPGTIKPARNEDLNVGASNGPNLTTGNSVKDAVRSAFADRRWNTGTQWDATDYIVNRESGWNPTAVNPSSGAFGLFQFLGSTQQQYLPDKNPDPGVQGQAGKRYIGDRYGDPTAARAFWDANHWYDRGGEANGIGHMLKNTIKPERMLSPEQTKSFDVGMRNGFGANNPEMIGLLRDLVDSNNRMLAILLKGGAAPNHFHGTDSRERTRIQKQQERDRRAALAGL